MTKFSGYELVNLLKSMSNWRKFQGSTVKDPQKNSKFILLYSFSCSAVGSNGIQIISIISSIREELIDQIRNQLNAFFLHGRIESIIKHGFKYFFHESFNVIEARCNFWTVFIEVVLLGGFDWEDVCGEDVGEENGRSDHLDPVAADGIFGVVSQDSSFPEDCLIVKDLTENLKGVVFV